MALRYQDIEVTTSLPTHRSNVFQGTATENLLRYENRPAVLVAYEIRDAAFVGQLLSFQVAEVDYIDAGGTASSLGASGDTSDDGVADDAVQGRVLFNYIPVAVSTTEENMGPIRPIKGAAKSEDNAVFTSGQDGPVYFNSKALMVDVYGGASATDAITIRLYYESAGDYRF
jgi:hypothetical protein